MLKILTGFDSLDTIFLISALVGAAIFVARAILNLFGHHGEIGSGGTFEIGGGDMATTDAMLAHDVGADGSQSGFRLLSVQGLMAFFLIFGLIGLALHRGSKFGDLTSIVGAFAAGLATMALMGKLMQFMLGLQSSGNFDIAQAVGRSGSVYLRIPAGGGTGQVQIEVSNHFMTLDATTEDEKEIKSGDRVEVVRISGGNVLVVKKI